MTRPTKIKRTEVMGIYKIWSSMIQRCTNERNAKYPQYGGRGITVCDRWRDFDLFYSDVGDKPFPGATIDRIENDAGYGPGNFRWASRKEQQRNRRSNHRLTFNGATKCLAEWEEETGVKSNTILTRIRRNWPVGEALGLLPHEQKNRLGDLEKKARTRKCKECGCEFMPRFGQIKIGMGKFCGNKCSLAHGLRIRWQREKEKVAL
ncbi:hypothetical protein MIH18_23680 (plasmid) [Marinobacter sp. M3C]|uniref:hypothetical protein n=1 Tax=Marinobacter sp. M3C TaxID=2917715 RepID=UPI00200E0592|nr:hypothetical protein [Marinobacter sp. M3C]MCL1485143.1 hypothetical protein [Marinobacter sp.]UQG62833.1 hypothetical protein MIH18_23680 [Marinobacter sp. M3C]